jgi:hypothetical protein
MASRLTLLPSQSLFLEIEMKTTLTIAAAAMLTLAAPAFAQTTGGNAAGMSGTQNGQTMGTSEGRAAAPDSSAAKQNRALRGTESNGNTNGNNMTRNNGQ